MPKPHIPHHLTPATAHAQTLAVIGFQTFFARHFIFKVKFVPEAVNLKMK